MSRQAAVARLAPAQGDEISVAPTEPPSAGDAFSTGSTSAVWPVPRGRG